MSRRSKNKPRPMAAPGNPSVAASKPSATESQPPPWWRRDWFVTLLFFAVTLLVYSRGLNGAFVWDDDKYISGNPAMRSLHGLWQIWFEPLSAGHQYYPLSFTLFWAAFQLWGLHTFGYHLVNVLLHAAASVLLWRVLKSLEVPGALLAGALFALHPVNVMSAEWMNEIKNTLSCSLALGVVWAWLHFERLGVYAREEKPGRPWGWYAAAILLFLLAMLAKTAVSFLPVSLLLILWWQRGRIAWRDFRPLLPVVGVIAGMGLLTIHVEHVASGATGKDFTVSFARRLVISGHSFFFYLWKLFVPVRLSFVYPRWEIDSGDWLQYLWPAAAAAVLAGLWLFRRAAGRGPWAAAMHFYISTSFLVFVVVPYRMRYSFVADHWLYFGSMSVFALAGAGLAKGAGALGGWQKPPAKILAAGLLLLLGAMSWDHTRMFDNYETLWRRTIAANPGCWMAENNLGNDLLSRGRVEESMGHFQRAIALKPDDVLAMNNLAKALLGKNRVDEAVIQFKKALALQPDDVQTLCNLGTVFQQQDRVVDAAALYRRALAVDPQFVPARLNLANALLNEGRVPEAIDLLKETAGMVPDYVPALRPLAYLLATSRDDRLRDSARAIELAERANRLTGGVDPLVLDTLAAAYAGAGRFSDAVATDSRAMAHALDHGKNTPESALIQKHIALYKTGRPLRDK